MGELQTKCHNGINEMFVKYHLEETVLEELRKIHNTMSDEHKLKTQIILTGHSLGGGTAQMLGAYFKSKSYLASDRMGKLMVETDKNHPNLSGQDRFLEMLTESKSILSPHRRFSLISTSSHSSLVEIRRRNGIGPISLGTAPSITSTNTILLSNSIF